MHSHTFKSKKPIAHVIDIDMGYGHSRAAHALKDLSGGKVITANAYDGIPDNELKLWNVWRQSYETLSRLRPIPIIGRIAFEIVERAQEIPDFYPRRDLSRETLPLREVMFLIEKRGLGKHLTEKLNANPLPAVCTHPVPAFCLETYGYQGDIWCIPTDADIARPWVSANPRESRIRYLCANGRLIERLKLYGVPEEHLFLTGFPLPKELIGGLPESILKKDLLARLCNLDPNGLFADHFQEEIKAKLGAKACVMKKSHPLTVMFAVGGAGAQRENGRAIMLSLERLLKRKKIRLILVAGTRKDVADYYRKAAKTREIPVTILYSANRDDYFTSFNKALHETDILWTKPSELAFYAGLGLPIIMAPPLGRQEEFNAIWLSYVGGGMAQDDVRYTDEWLFDWLKSGGLARAAWQGYTQAPTHGTYRIEDLISGRTTELLPPPLVV